MSDGYADDDGYSAYSSSPEWYWNDDVEPTQADDLAEHTLPSPIWDEDRWYLNETHEYHSDWEYYSDDYFDQKCPNPNEDIRQKDSKPGPLPSDRHIEQHRDKRAKHSESSVLGPQDTRKGRFIRGVVYRDTTRSYGGTVNRNHEPDDVIYEPGKSEKEALFEDWRKTFYNSRPEREVKDDMLRHEKPRSSHILSEKGHEEVIDIAPLDPSSDFPTTLKDPAEHQTPFPPYLEKPRPSIQVTEKGVDVEPGGQHGRDL